MGMVKVIIEVPDECYEKRQRGEACVFNNGIFGYCLCFEHYKIRHGQDQEVIDKYFCKYPNRVPVLKPQLMYLRGVE
jgi:hypothetical protein